LPIKKNKNEKSQDFNGVLISKNPSLFQKDRGLARDFDFLLIILFI
jgi:hypothetical protein